MHLPLSLPPSRPPPFAPSFTFSPRVPTMSKASSSGFRVVASAGVTMAVAVTGRRAGRKEQRKEDVRKEGRDGWET